jgi:hypothetical protein
VVVSISAGSLDEGAREVVRICLVVCRLRAHEVIDLHEICTVSEMHVSHYDAKGHTAYSIVDLPNM